MNPFCLKLDFSRNRLRMPYFLFLRYAFFFLTVMLSGIYAPFSFFVAKWFGFLERGSW